MKEEFAEEVNNNVMVMKIGAVVDVASEVCGYTKGKPRHFETRCWNKDVNVAVCRKRELYKIWKQSQNEEDRKKYYEAKKKKMLREVVEKVERREAVEKAREAVEKVDSCRDGRVLFRIAQTKGCGV